MQSGLDYASRAGPHSGGGIAHKETRKGAVTALSPHKQKPIMPLPPHTAAQHQLLLKRDQFPAMLHKAKVPKKLILASLQAQHVSLKFTFLG